ncbi:hypothetical protein BCR42DRAFT_334858 [Absidia repens]|uniref:PSP proline-rich domain-containing protein n=1 Tax=Absidia repens TaxID=90262 RepID=A0A1X2I4G4_9FUNG|nr:hypothetical protein BCR42DRAFT_334858 [Absidia repens]
MSSTDDSQLQQEVDLSLTDNAIDYVTAPIDLAPLDCYGQDVVQQFSAIFKRFETLSSNNKGNDKQARKTKTQNPIASKDEESNDDRIAAGASHLLETPLSRKKLKVAQRYTFDELKTLATAPEVVEVWDTSAMDPLLLVDLKSYRNTVPVPLHWRQRQKYLYRHRSEEKPPFDLPDFIKDTGVMEVRDNLKKQQEQKRQKAKTRERRNPKLGKTDLDYQVLHDAFFLYQTEPHLTPHGDLYYERKETVSQLKNKKPGQLSDELKNALGILSMPLAPPPWLLQMQRYGPPPSYPHLKIPGLTAPIPAGAQWGLQKGGWGLIPVDGFNRPLYADVFKNSPLSNDAGLFQDETVNRTLWGELENDYDDNDDSSDNENNNTDIPTTADQPISVLDTEKVKPINVDVGLELETGKRKRPLPSKNNQDSTILPKLYDIIPSKKATGITGLMGSQHIYELPSASSSPNGPRPTGTALNNIGHTWNKTQDITVSLDPNDLNDYGTAVQEMYQKAQEEHMPEGVGGQELKQMYTDYAKRQAKRKRQMDIKNADKKKDFRF